MPSGKTAQPEIIDNKDGTVTVKYAPTEPGLHEMHIKYNGTHIPGGSPLFVPALMAHANAACLPGAAGTSCTQIAKASTLQ